MYRECFLFSDKKISSKSKLDTIYLHSNDADIFVCNQIPYFAYFKIPIYFQKEWIFYANETPIKITVNNSVSVPFYKLQNLFDNSKIKNKIDSSSVNKEISRALHNSLDVWFHNDGDENLINDDIIIFFKIISTNFSFNHFSNVYNKIHPSFKHELQTDNESNQIEIIFKKFLLSVRPNGKPNPNPLFNFTSSFLIFFHQLKYSEYFLTHKKFVSSGIHYILDYLHNDNEWGPYSVLSFISRQLEIEHIQSYPLINYDIEQNPEFFFDKKNLKCIEESVSIFGKIILLWCYNPCFHNDFINIVKKFFGKHGKKINRKELYDIILCRICNDNEDKSFDISVNDYSSFYKFVQIVSPETDNNQIFSEIYKIICSKNSEEKKLIIPFKFKLFYENEIKGQINKVPEKISWIKQLEEQKQFNLSENFIESFFDFKNEAISNYHLSSNDFKNFEPTKIDFKSFEDEFNEISSNSQNKNLNDHYIIFSDSLSNANMNLQNPSFDEEQVIENFDQWPEIKERFRKMEVKFIKNSEKKGRKEDEFNVPFNFAQNSLNDHTLDGNIENSKSKTEMPNNSNVTKIQNNKKSKKELISTQMSNSNKEKATSII